MNGDQLDVYVSEMLDQQDQLDGISPAVRVQLVSDLKERLLDQINRALIDSLPETKIGELNALLDDETASDERVQEFISRNGVDVEGTTLQTIRRFNDSYLGRDKVTIEETSDGNFPMSLAGRWLKTVDGRQFVVDLRDDHTLLESLKEAPGDTWSGTWSRGRTLEKGLEDLGFTIALKIGEHLTMLRQVEGGYLNGIERNYDTNLDILMPADGRQTQVELVRIE